MGGSEHDQSREAVIESESSAFLSLLHVRRLTGGQSRLVVVVGLAAAAAVGRVACKDLQLS